MKIFRSRKRGALLGPRLSNLPRCLLISEPTKRFVSGPNSARGCALACPGPGGRRPTIRAGTSLGGESRFRRSAVHSNCICQRPDAACPFPIRHINSSRRSTFSHLESAIFGISADSVGLVPLMPFCTDARPRGQTISEFRSFAQLRTDGRLSEAVHHWCPELDKGTTGAERDLVVRDDEPGTCDRVIRSRIFSAS